MNPLKPSKIIRLDPQVQAYADVYAETLSALEEEEYQSDLVPFSQKKAQIKEQVVQLFSDNQQKLQRAQILLKQMFALQKSSRVDFSVWEEAVKKLKIEMENRSFYNRPIEEKLEALQVTAKIPSAFMQQAYDCGMACLNEKRFDEGECIFLFLHYLNPNVFDYWLGEALCQEEQKDFAAALLSYVNALTFNTKKEVIFYQMASCLYQLKEKKASLQSLDLCIEYAKRDAANPELLQLAVETKSSIETTAA